MSMQYIIALDLGTTVEKCVIYDEEGAVVAQTSEEIEAKYPKPGAAEIDSNDFYNHSCSIIKKCLKDSKIDVNKIAVISIDSLMGGIMGIDRNYNPVTYYDTAMDSRGAYEQKYMTEKYGDLSLEYSGAYSIWGHKILYWKKKAEYKNIYKFVHPVAFVAGKLTGLTFNEAFIDQSFLSLSGFSNLSKSEWSEEICKKLEIDLDKLPKIVKATDIIGETTSAIFNDTGLPKGIPVCAGCGDVAAGFIGSNILGKGQAIDISGTANILSVNVGDFKYHKNFATMKSPIDDVYYIWVSHVLGGRTLKWFVEEFYSELENDFRKREENIYKYLDDKANLIPIGSGGLISIDDLQGRFFPPYPNFRGLFLGHTWAHKKIHFYRAILEAIAYDYNLGVEILRKIEPDINIEKIVAVGSGSDSDIWLQIKSDCLQIPFESLIRTDLSSLGAAVIGGLSVGIVKDIELFLKKILRVKKRINPCLQNKQKYEKYFNIYKDLIIVMNEYYNRIV